MADNVLVKRSRDFLKRYAGGRDRLYPLLEMHTQDMVVHRDDFLGDTIRGDATAPGAYEVVTGVDGAINILANQVNGVAEVRASDGAGADDEYCGVSLPELNFQGQLNCNMAVRLQIDAIATVKVEIGFTDVTTDAGAVDALATPTFTATDAAVWVLDTDDTANWQCAGVQAGSAATKIEPGFAPTAATFETLQVSIEGTTARFLRYDANGRNTYDSSRSGEDMTNAITGTTQLVPWVFVQLRAGSIDRNLQLDFFDAWQRRTTS
jgi:hypothetical protein